MSETRTKRIAKREISDAGMLLRIELLALVRGQDTASDTAERHLPSAIKSEEELRKQKMLQRCKCEINSAKLVVIRH